MIRVLFVCLGNICRSPIAEGVFSTLIHDKGLQERVSCDSAGTAGYHQGSLPDTRMRLIAQRHGITLNHQARQIQTSDFSDFDYIIAMDASNKVNIRQFCRERTGAVLPESQVLLFRTFDPKHPELTDVPDPYYSGQEAFEEVYRIVSRCALSFMEHLLAQHPSLIA
ncbi:protein-tyrosine phosphatase [Dyadobacter jejuensis]|uniref:protein-tyrosine-phosphatase n=1 Tax=Dyadobacter jejuensis TaxID=1082580 RepID=A0A316AKB5_9BACT|nr:low molecular weight protein-tyrosine-phosphatase [Dyadobacter jejuensis]PWJ57689.1 protein-tyrosine phosphatase [Dyadobacter jejuensis]